MISVEVLKKRRNEWHEDNYTWVMLDAADCIHRLQRVHFDTTGKPKWALAWVFIDTPWSVPQISASSFETDVEAKAWVDGYFSDHFEWFEAA